MVLEPNRPPQIGDTLLILSGRDAGKLAKVYKIRYSDPFSWDIVVIIDDLFVWYDFDKVESKLQSRYERTAFLYITS